MADDLILPGYLRHAATGAWFDPLTFAASFPARIAEAVEEEKLAILHEQVHYLQAMSTMFGAIRFLSRWQSLIGLARVKTRRRLGMSNAMDDLVQVRVSHEDRRAAIEDLALPMLLDVSDDLRGVQVVDVGDRTLVVFAKPSQDGSRLFPLGAHAIQEGMAMSIERAIGRSDRSYERAAQSNGWPFLYAAPAEAVRSELGDGEDLWWITAALCDVALDHAVPHIAFMLGLKHLAKQFGRLPLGVDLAAIHTSLRNAVQMEEVDRNREQIIQDLAGVVARGAGSDEPLDRAFAKLFSSILDAFEIRRSMPHTFVQAVLDPGGQFESLERFLLPAYVVRDQLLTLSNDPDLIQAVVFLMIDGHYLGCSLDEQATRACPLRDLKHCTFDRVEACTNEPWVRPQVGHDACAYRFVAHAMEHAGNWRSS